MSRPLPAKKGRKRLLCPTCRTECAVQRWGSPFPSKIKRRGSYKAIWHFLAGFQTYQIRIVIRYLEHRRYMVYYQITV